MADIQIEAKSSENERRSLKKECTDMKLISSGLKISCNKCKESFKTAGLMRRHQRLGCEKQNRGKNSCEQVVQGGSNKKNSGNVAHESDFVNRDCEKLLEGANKEKAKTSEQEAKGGTFQGQESISEKVPKGTNTEEGRQPDQGEQGGTVGQKGQVHKGNNKEETEHQDQEENSENVGKGSDGEKRENVGYVADLVDVPPQSLSIQSSPIPLPIQNKESEKECLISRCPKCKSTFKTAGLLRRHQRLDCDTEGGNVKGDHPTSPEVYSKTLAKPLTQESLVLTSSEQDSPIEAKNIHHKENDKSKNKVLKVNSGQQETPPLVRSCSLYREPPMKFDTTDQKGVSGEGKGRANKTGCQQIPATYTDLKPICMFRIHGCSKRDSCKFTHDIPKHLYMPLYCEPFLRGKCTMYDCHNLFHISFKDLNIWFFEGLHRLSQRCCFCDRVPNSPTSGKQVIENQAKAVLPGTSQNEDAKAMDAKNLGSPKVVNFTKDCKSDQNSEIRPRPVPLEDFSGSPLYKGTISDSKGPVLRPTILGNLLENELEGLMDKNRLQKSVTWDNCSQIDTRGSNLLPQFRDQSEIQTNLYFFILQLGNLLFLQPDHTMTMVDFVEVMWLSKITPYHFGFSRWVDLLNATSLVALVGSTQVKIKLLAKEQNAALESFKANASKLLQMNSPLTLNTFGEVYCKEFAFPFHKKLCEKTLSYVLNFVPSSNIVLTKSGYILKNIPELKSGISNVRSK